MYGHEIYDAFLDCAGDRSTQVSAVKAMHQICDYGVDHLLPSRQIGIFVRNDRRRAHEWKAYTGLNTATVIVSDGKARWPDPFQEGAGRNTKTKRHFSFAVRLTDTAGFEKMFGDAPD